MRGKEGVREEKRNRKRHIEGDRQREIQSETVKEEVREGDVDRQS